jgi:hypothetical protein
VITFTIAPTTAGWVLADTAVWAGTLIGTEPLTRTVTVVDGAGAQALGNVVTAEFVAPPETLQTLTAPTNTTLSQTAADGAAAIALLPTTVTVTTTGMTTSLPINWSVAGFDAAPGATNTFTWTAQLGGILPGSIITTGTIVVTNHMPYSITTHTVNFVAGAGGTLAPSPPHTITVTSGAAIQAGQVPQPVPNAGYNFVNWTPSNPVNHVVTANTTFRANFAAQPNISAFTITFDGNGGSPQTQTRVTGSNGRLTSLPFVSRSNHNFQGWFTAGGTQITTATVFNANTTVFARWTLVSAAAPAAVDGGWIGSANVYSTSLTMPSNVRLSNTTISWNPVQNATSYRIYVGGTFRTEVTTTSFDLDTLGLSIGTHPVRIRAVSDGARFINSLLSPTINFVVTTAPSVTDDTTPAEPVTDDATAEPVTDDIPPWDDAAIMPAYEVHASVHRQLEQDAAMVVLTADEAVSEILVYRDTIALLAESQVPLRIVRDIVWVELSAEQIVALLNNMGSNDDDLVISMDVFLDDNNADGANIYFVAASVSFAANNGAMRTLNNDFTLFADLSGFNLQGLNHHRLTAIHNNRNVGGYVNPATGVFTLNVTATGEFTIAYVENLRRIAMQLGSSAIVDMAGNHPAQTMDVLPVIVNDRTMLPVRFVADALGAEVDWTPAAGNVPMLIHLDLDGQSLTFAIGETAPGMDVPAQIVDSRTMVPLRFIVEFFGATVSWDDATRGIEIVR